MNLSNRKKKIHHIIKNGKLFFLGYLLCTHLTWTLLNEGWSVWILTSQKYSLFVVTNDRACKWNKWLFSFELNNKPIIQSPSFPLYMNLFPSEWMKTAASLFVIGSPSSFSWNLKSPMYLLINSFKIDIILMKLVQI